MSAELRESSTQRDRSSLAVPFRTLSATQQKAFEELKELCEKNKVYWPTSELEPETACGGVNDDMTLLRYLRARYYDPKAAFKQYSASAAWRRKAQLDNVYDNVDINKFETMRRLLPQWTGSRDRKGVPIFVYVVSEIQTKDVLEVGKEDPKLTSVFLPAEYVTRFIHPLCGNLHGDGRVDCSTNIIDLSGVGARHFWNLRNLLQTTSRMATAHYPETVERIFIVGAPSFFPTVWTFITRWFDPNTTSKIKIVPTSSVTSTLTEYIDPANLPKRYGGTLDWEFGMHPMLDQEAKSFMGDLPTPWVEGPARYISRVENDEIIAVGSDKGERRRKVLAKPQVRGMTRSEGIDVEKKIDQTGDVRSIE